MDGTSKVDKKQYLILAVVCLLYLIFRLGWQDTIEFGYDQPLLASKVIEFFKNPNWIESYEFVGTNPWGFPSWGPMQLFFWVPFILMSRDPIILSLSAAVFNMLSIILIFIIGKRYFSLKVAVFSSLFLAIHPWWVVFSRMIYEPTPVPTIIAFSILLSFYVFEKKKTSVVVLLIISWAALIQIYIHTFSFVVTSVLFLLASIKKTSKKYMVLGFLLSLLLFLPVFHYYVKYPDRSLDLLKVLEEFNKGDLESGHSTRDVLPEFLKTISGDGFEWQLGYAYPEFQKELKIAAPAILATITTLAVLIYGFISVFEKGYGKHKTILLLLWTLAPVWFLFLINTPIALPRYFLMSLPPLSILFGLAVEKFYTKVKYFTLIAALFVLFWWLVFNAIYLSFIGNYKYPSGFLSHYSDVPYLFLKDAVLWIIEDSAKKGYIEFTISNDINKPYEFSLNAATEYVLKYVYEIEFRDAGSMNVGHYLLIYSNESIDVTVLKQFGPYIVAYPKI